MECLHFQNRRETMLKETYLRIPNIRLAFENNPSEVFAWLIGKHIIGKDYEEACTMWERPGSTINCIDKGVVKKRSGVG